MTANELQDLWATRDRRYGMRRFGGLRQALSPQEVKSVIWWRREECLTLLAGRDQAVALATLSQWSPPPPMS